MTGEIKPLKSVEMPKENSVTISVGSAPVPKTLGGPTADLKIEENVESLSKKEGCTCGHLASVLKKAGKGGLRGLAGLAGIPLYAAAAVVGGTLSLAVFVVAGTIAIPPALLGATIGIFTKTGVKKGAEIGGALGFIVPAVLAEIALAIPKGIVMGTVGRIGAGLTSFALKGTQEKNDALVNKLSEITTAVYPFIDEFREKL